MPDYLVKLTKITITSVIEKSRDAKDNYLLGMAMDGDANYLVTGDPDLLELKAIQTTQIVTITEFLQSLQ